MHQNKIKTFKPFSYMNTRVGHLRVKLSVDPTDLAQLIARGQAASR